MNNLTGLINNQTLKFAVQPKANPQSLEFESYTIPLIEHDYPAKTPVMWNAVYEKYNFPTRNVMLVGSSQSIPEIFEVLRADSKYLGGGAGVGFKDEAVKFLDELDPAAEAIGAVNFILKTPERKLKGFNTDGLGYAQSLADVFASRGEKLQGKKVVMLGAGGTGNAVGFALAQYGVRLVILNRTVATAETLANKINQFYGLPEDSKVRFGGEADIADEVADADAVVNVSTKGAAGAMEEYSALAPAQLPANEENIAANHNAARAVLEKIPSTAVVSDIVLGTKATPMMDVAAKSGFLVLDGIPMVINQGVEAFWILHGSELVSKGVTKSDLQTIMTKAASQ